MIVSPLFSHIVIIGLGMMGSSLARTIRARGIAHKITGVDSSKNVCERVAALNLVDTMTRDAQNAVQSADLTLICVPIGAYGAVGKAIGPALKAGSLVGDIGSVKGEASKMLAPYIPERVDFVPGHPIAGTEKSGPDAGFDGLFDARWCILTPQKTTSIKSVERMSAFWEACGARIAIMEPEHHDLVLAITSHLPHLLAYTIVGTAAQLEDDVKGEVIQYSAGGFRGFTRIAGSDPTMWRDIFLNNRTAVLEILQRFSEDLSAVQKAIRRGDGEFLFDVFTRARAIRQKITALGEEGLPAPQERLRD